MDLRPDIAELDVVEAIRLKEVSYQRLEIKQAGTKVGPFRFGEVGKRAVAFPAQRQLDSAEIALVGKQAPGPERRFVQDEMFGNQGSPQRSINDGSKLHQFHRGDVSAFAALVHRPVRTIYSVL